MSLDNFRNRTIIWDTVNKDFPQTIQIMKGDVNARTLLIKIIDNGIEVDLSGHSLKLTYQYTDNSNSGFIMIPPKDLTKGEFVLVIPTEMTITGVIDANLILLNESLEQVIVSKPLIFISDNSTVTDLAQEVNNKIDDFTKLLLENMPQVLRSELNDLHAQTDSNTSNIELKANLADMTSLQNAMTNLQNEVEAFGITPENLVTIKSLLDAIASNASESQVVELINSVNVLTSNISLMSNGDYSPKANQTDLESLQSVVNNQSATISTKANQTDLNNLQTTVNSQGIAISTKAEQSDLLITNQNVTTAQTTANQAETDAQTAIANAAAAQANSLPLNGNAVSASKLVTARKLQVSLQTSTYQNFDGTSDATNVGVAGVLPIVNGGTATSDGVVNTIAYANSADGTDGFTTVYPNLNLLKNTKSQSYTSTGTTNNNSSNIYPLDGVVADILNKPLTITYNYAITNSSGTWSGTIRPTYGLGGTNQSVSNTNLSGTHKETVTLISVSQNSYGILTSGLPTGTIVTITNLKVEFGSINTNWMPSVSEVTKNDYPKYIGFSNVIKPNKTNSDYKWLPMGLVSIDNATGLLKPAVIGIDYAQAHPVGSVVSNASNLSSGYSTGTWKNIGSAVIGSTTIYYWERTA